MRLMLHSPLPLSLFLLRHCYRFAGWPHEAALLLLLLIPCSGNLVNFPIASPDGHTKLSSFLSCCSSCLFFTTPPDGLTERYFYLSTSISLLRRMASRSATRRCSSMFAPDGLTLFLLLSRRMASRVTLVVVAPPDGLTELNLVHQCQCARRRLLVLVNLLFPRVGSIFRLTTSRCCYRCCCRRILTL